MEETISDSGCWYCHKDGDLVYSSEFDCGVHIECIKKAIKANKNDDEAQIFCIEFGIAY